MHRLDEVLLGHGIGNHPRDKRRKPAHHDHCQCTTHGVSTCHDGLEGPEARERERRDNARGEEDRNLRLRVEGKKYYI